MKIYTQSLAHVATQAAVLTVTFNLMVVAGLAEGYLYWFRGANV